MDLKESMKVCQTSCWIHFVVMLLEIKLTMEIVIYEKICTIT
jgi:hypothetical protein